MSPNCHHFGRKLCNSRGLPAHAHAQITAHQPTPPLKLTLFKVTAAAVFVDFLIAGEERWLREDFFTIEEVLQEIDKCGSDDVYESGWK